MKFQPGHSGNPAGRPPGSLNKKTLALQEAFEAKAEGIVDDVIGKAKNGHGTAMRLVMERAVPIGRNRRFAIELPVITTADDAEAAVAVVLAELAAGKLAAHEVSSLLLVIERMLRVAERVWKMREAERERAADAVAQSVASAPETMPEPAAIAAAAAAKSADAGGERLYFPVNQADGGAAEGAGVRAEGRPHPSDRQARPQAKAA
jgi:Family of unknown function (DUF5681)